MREEEVGLLSPLLKKDVSHVRESKDESDLSNPEKVGNRGSEEQQDGQRLVGVPDCCLNGHNVVNVNVGLGSDLFAQGYSKVVETGECRGTQNGIDSRSHIAISMLGDIPLLDKQTPVDPFRNKTYEITGLYEWTKTVLCLSLLILRILMTSLVIFVGFISTKLAMAGWTSKLEPLPRWRSNVMYVTRLCGRAVLFCFGFHWISRTGQRAPREVAPIVVSNHVSFVDPIFYFYELFPIMVSSESHDNIFMVGTIIRAMQVILVNRLSPESRRRVASEIKRKALCNDYPCVLLFPEGTTTNGRALISFKPGAFRPGVPVQPVVVRYPFVHCDISWGNISVWKVVFRMLTQVTNHMEVEYLPVVVPTEREKENPAVFSERVRYSMAKALNVPETEHTYEDLMLAVKSSQLKAFEGSNSMVEMGKMEKLFHLTTMEVKEYWVKFSAMDSSNSGYVTIDQFLEALDLPRCHFSEQVFLMFDRAEHGYINFREFVSVLGFISRRTEFAALIKHAFDACNIDKDGLLSPSEFDTSLRSVFPEISKLQVQQMFEKLDVNSDGNISWDEFRTFLMKNPEFLAVFIAVAYGI